MQIYVCVKHVPDTAANIKVVAPAGFDESVKFVVNPYDEYGLEEALQIVAKAGGEIVAVTVGKESAVSSLRTEPSYGRTLPATLRTDDADWQRTEHPNPSWWHRYLPWCNSAEDKWHSWMVIAPDSAKYRIELQGAGEGSMVLEVDGEPLSRLSSFEEAGRSVEAHLTRGAHAIRVITTGDASVEGVKISAWESRPKASN